MHPDYELIENFTGLLVFEVAGREYCINDAIVISTVRPPFDLSLSGRQKKKDNHHFNVNNRTIPLIYLKKILNPEESGGIIGRDSRIIIIEKNDEQYGLLVDRIKEFIALDTKYISTCIKFNPEIDMPAGYEGHKYLEGSLEIDNRCILLINVKPLLNSIALLRN